MSPIRISLLVISLGAALLGCSEEPMPIAPGQSGVTVLPPGELTTHHDRCAYAVAKIAAAQFDCTPEEIELHPVGPGAFLTSGCDKLGTFLCDELTGQARVSRQR